MILGGYLAAGGAGAINHYLERERDARMARTCGRPLVAGRIEPVHGLDLRNRPRRDRHAAARAHREPAGRGAGARRAARLRIRLHAVAEAADAAEHRHRRGRRRGSAAGRLGRRDRRADAGRALPVRDRLPLDAAPLLGPLAAGQGRLRARPGCRCFPSPVESPPRGARSSPTRIGPRRVDGAPRPDRVVRSALPRRRARARAPASSASPPISCPAVAARRRSAFTWPRSPTSRCCSPRWPWTG